MFKRNPRPTQQPPSRSIRLWDDVVPVGLIPVAAAGPTYLLWEAYEFVVLVVFGG